MALTTKEITQTINADEHLHNYSNYYPVIPVYSRTTRRNRRTTKTTEMREIKFRAWGAGKMWYPPNVRFKFDWDSGIQVVVKNDIGATKPIKAKVMQFTGLYDKNGKEIYEGDIVRVNHPDYHIVSQIIWGSKGGWHPEGTLFENLSEFIRDISGKNISEITGNIYEK